ncbi:MAG: alpha/beta fold hydrolase [Chloroflexota bacterium]|nr:alpha/beta fold hydrolase [Chloroflexota bacterium]
MRLTTIETQVTFENEGEKLYGFLVRPAGPGPQPDPHPAVALYDGMGGSSHGPRRMFAQLCRMLAVEGLAALRFSFRGNGDSEGDYKDVTIERELSDARMALGFLARQPGLDVSRLGLVGMSLGGLVAAGTAGTHSNVRALVLWSAVAHNGERANARLTSEQRDQLRRLGYYDNGGFAVNRTFHEQFTSMDGVQMVAGYEGPALVIHGTEDTSVPVEDAYRYKEAFGDRADLVVLEGANHIFSSLEWERTVLESTVAFLRRHLL